MTPLLFKKTKRIRRTILKVNESHVVFTNPKTLKKESVDVSRLIRVFVINVVQKKERVLSNVKRKYKKENIYISI